MYMMPETITSWSAVKIGRSASGMGWAPMAAQMAVVDFTSVWAISPCTARSSAMRAISTRASFGIPRASIDINCCTALLTVSSLRSLGISTT